MGAYLPRISLLDYFSASHYHYSIAQVFHHGDIVCDKKKSQIHFFAQILEKIYYLSLDGNIESAYRFVANYKVRLYRLLCAGAGLRRIRADSAPYNRLSIQRFPKAPPPCRAFSGGPSS